MTETYIESVHADEWLCDRWRDAEKSRQEWNEVMCALHGAQMVLPSFSPESEEVEFLYALLWKKYDLELLDWQLSECDACGKRTNDITRQYVSGIETYACQDCVERAIEGAELAAGGER